MSATGFAYLSTRSQLARLHVRMNKTVVGAIVATVVVLLGVGTLMVAVGMSFGYVVASLSAWPIMIYLWQQRYLSNLPPDDGDAIDQRLEGSVLGRLPRQLTPRTLAEQLSNARSAQFMMARSGLSPQMLAQVLGDDEAGIPLVWAAARDMQPTGIVHASTIVAALTKTSPELVRLLPHLQLDERDLPQLAQWYQRLDYLIHEHNRSKRTGGVARDWSFGYMPTLERFGTNVSARVANSGAAYVQREAHQQALDHMTQIFSARGRQNIALVGPLGVGKTTIVNAFAQRLLDASAKLPTSLRFRQVISLDAGSLISAASGRGELEGLLNRLLMEAYSAKNVILCLDDAQLFFEEGVGSVDMSNILLPVLEGGGMRMILTMDEQRWLQIASRNPALSSSINRFAVASANDDETLEVLQDHVINLEFQFNVMYMYQALRESIRLSERYLYDQSQPGKAIQALTAAAQFAQDGAVTARSVQLAIEQGQGVKVGAVSGDEEKKKLLNLEDLIHQRMINQKRAVHVVSDALRRARAGVRNEQRPVGTFLFLGPTGTGKTELAKSLAAVYFGGEDRMIRLDLNEFVRADDVARLIADGADDPMSLSAQVMKQPFSVILLDEIEKAHDAVLAALLQVLDEGILRDSRGREVSFRDTIFIATSNAGAEQIRHHIEAGEDLDQFQEALQRELITSHQFRPEFLNRFDEVVLFAPLVRDDLFQIIDLMIASTNKTLANKQISLQVTEEAKAKLVDLGYDPQLGARPLRRVVQRTVESLIAKRMLADEVQPGETIQIDAGDIQ